jgi:hypothetical protein
MPVQPNRDQDELELLALAEATDRVAAAIGDATIKARLHMIANEVRAMVRRGGGSLGGSDMAEACCLPA